MQIQLNLFTHWFDKIEETNIRYDAWKYPAIICLYILMK